MIDRTINTPSIRLGPRTSNSLLTDPKHMCFVLSRYKFCSKLLYGKSRVLEVGCGDAFGTPIVADVVDHLLCVDCESRLIDGNKDRLSLLSNVEFRTVDMTTDVPCKGYDAVYSIDVLEHISREEEFMANILASLAHDGVVIIGTPNVESEEYATEPGATLHINLHSHDTLRTLMDRFFVQSFIFSMNDEVVHTGFYPMAHYLFAVGIGLRKEI